VKCQATRIANCPDAEFHGERLVCDDTAEGGSAFCEADGNLLIHHDRSRRVNWSSTVGQTERLSDLTGPSWLRRVVA
jgi:hypothetical protein